MSQRAQKAMAYTLAALVLIGLAGVPQLEKPAIAVGGLILAGTVIFHADQIAQLSNTYQAALRG